MDDGEDVWNVIQRVYTPRDVLVITSGDPRSRRLMWKIGTVYVCVMSIFCLLHGGRYRTGEAAVESRTPFAENYAITYVITQLCGH